MSEEETISDQELNDEAVRIHISTYWSSVLFKIMLNEDSLKLGNCISKKMLLCV